MMPTLGTRKEILEAEQAILRSLIQAPFPQSQRKELARVLGSYNWESSEHQILFEVLLHSRIGGAESLRDQLPAMLTRKGFPDLDLACYFAAEALTATEALSVARALAARTHGEQ